MAGKKGWDKAKHLKPEPIEVSASDGLEQVLGNDTVRSIDSGVPDTAASPGSPTAAMEEQVQQDMTFSCMNGCPHFFPTPEAQGKYMGLCRRFPPVPSAAARYFAWPVFINHPVRGFPKYPICGEHPVFQHRKDFKPSQELQVE